MFPAVDLFIFNLSNLINPKRRYCFELKLGRLDYLVALKVLDPIELHGRISSWTTLS